MPLAETYLAKSTDIAARTLGDETIIMSTLDSTIFMLNPDRLGYLGSCGRQYSTFTHHREEGVRGVRCPRRTGFRGR